MTRTLAHASDLHLGRDAVTDAAVEVVARLFGESAAKRLEPSLKVRM